MELSYDEKIDRDLKIRFDAVVSEIELRYGNEYGGDLSRDAIEMLVQVKRGVMHGESLRDLRFVANTAHNELKHYLVKHKEFGVSNVAYIANHNKIKQEQFVKKVSEYRLSRTAETVPVAKQKEIASSVDIFF